MTHKRFGFHVVFLVLAMTGLKPVVFAQQADAPVQIAPEAPLVEVNARADAPVFTTTPVVEEQPVAPPAGSAPPGSAPPPQERIPTVSAPPQVPAAPPPAQAVIPAPQPASPTTASPPPATPAPPAQATQSGAGTGLTTAEPVSSEAAAAVVREMKSLIEQERFAEAFNLGLKNDRFSGEPLYDYYFGIAAVDSGRASLGVLALERVLLSNPGNDLARLELARGYFVLEDFERAREEFQILLGRRLPQTVKTSVERYLAAIRDKDPEFRRIMRGYAEYTIGHNSNVNSSADQIILYPVFGQANAPVPVDPGAAKSSALSQLAFGLSTSGPIVPGIKYLAAFDGYHRQYASVSTFDQSLGGLSGGFEFSGEKGKYRLIGYYSDAYLDSERLRKTTGIAADWVQPIDRDTTLRSGVSFSQLRYPGQPRDADLPNFSIGVNRLLGGEWRNSLDLELSVGREKNLQNRPDYSRDIYGLKAIWAFVPGGRWIGSVIGSFSKSQYDAPDTSAPRPDEYKQDNLYSLEFALQYQLTRGWSARGELIFNKNASNIALYEYRQDLGLVKMRYEWK